MEGLEELKHILRTLGGEPDKDLTVLNTLCTTRHFKKRDLLLKKDGRPIYSGLVVAGAFREYYIDDNGREYNKAFSFKGDLTGSYYDLNSGRPALVSIEALTDSTAILLSQSKFTELKCTDQFWSKVGYSVAHNLLMNKFEKEAQLLTLNASERYELLKKEHPYLEQLVPAYHIASYLGITPMSLSRLRAAKKSFLIK